MLSALLVSMVLSQGSSTMGGPPPASINGTAGPDFFTYLPTSPAVGAQCTDAEIVSGQGDAITCTRATTAYCTNGSSTMSLMSIDRCRVEADGLLVEGGRTNLVLRGDELGNGAWSDTGLTATADTHAGPWGGTTMETLTKAAGVSRYQSLAAVGVGPHTLSGYNRAVTGTHDADLEILCNAGPPTACTCRTILGATCTPVIASSVCTGIASSIGTTVDRLEVTATCPVGNATVLAIVTVLAGSHVWGGIQFEQVAPFASSLIRTAGTAVARATDVVTTVPTKSIDLAGCVSADVKLPLAYTNAGRIFSAAASGSAGVPLYVNTTAGFGMWDSTNTATVAASPLYGNSHSVRSSWADSLQTVYVAGGANGSSAFDGDMDLPTIYLGSENGASPLYGHMKNVQMNINAGGCQ